MNVAYHTVDVFTEAALEGNPLAVFPDARSIGDRTMQRIARELNLSETTFVLPPSTSAYAARLRIFTPAYEMAFAGHPTVGTAYVLRTLGIVPREAARFVLEENIGPVPIRVDEGPSPLIWLETPPITRGAIFSAPLCAQALGLAEADVLPDVPCRVLSAGNPNIYVAVRDKRAVDRAEVDTAALRTLVASEDAPTCLFVFTATPEGAYSRMFAPEFGVVEDPATGSATGPLAAYMMDHALVGRDDGTRFISEQGTKMGRRSILHVLVRGAHGNGPQRRSGQATAAGPQPGTAGLRVDRQSPHCVDQGEGLGSGIQ
ncbi:MAG: PhzF family phenazine biosynthesis protein, partial [Candidatus Velthaea sp.]